MRRFYILSLCTIATLVCASVNSNATAQQKSLKEQLVGTWGLMLISTKLPDGTLVWGSDPIGLLIFTDNGLYSLQLMRSDRPKFASNNPCLSA